MLPSTFGGTCRNCKRYVRELDARALRIVETLTRASPIPSLRRQHHALTRSAVPTRRKSSIAALSVPQTSLIYTSAALLLPSSRSLSTSSITFYDNNNNNKSNYNKGNNAKSKTVATVDPETSASLFSAALEQSSAITAQSLVSAILQHLKKRTPNPSRAWDGYTDLALRDMLPYLSRDHYSELIRLFGARANHADALQYVLALIEDMKALGHGVGDREKLTLMRLLGMNGNISAMEQLFNDIRTSPHLGPDDQKLFNTVLTIYQGQRHRIGFIKTAEQSMEVYDDMIQRGIVPTAATTRLLMENVRSAGYASDMVRNVWSWFWKLAGDSVTKEGRSFDMSLYKEMVMYFTSAGHPSYALEISDRMVQQKIPRDVQLMTALIHKVGRAGHVEKAGQLFQEMVQVERIVPTRVTFNALIDVYAHKRPEPDLNAAIDVYDRLEEFGLEPDAHTLGPLIDMFAKQGDLQMVKQLYSDMVKARRLRPTSHIYSSLIECFINNDDSAAAIQVFELMKQRKPIDERPNEVTYNLLVRSYARSRDFHRAVAMLSAMHEAGVDPNARTFTPLLGVIADDGNVAAVKRIMEKMQEFNVEPSVHTYTALLETYAKAGDLERCEFVFKELKQRCIPNVEPYNTLLYIYTKKNEMDKVLDTYKRMLKSYIKMNSYTYVLLMLFFARRKEIAAVERLMGSMTTQGVEPHVHNWTVLMQAYLDNGQFQEGLNVLERMRKAGVGPSNVTLSILIDACVRNNSVSLAESILNDAIERSTSQAGRDIHYGDYEPTSDSQNTATRDMYRDHLPKTIEDILASRTYEKPKSKPLPPHVFNPLLTAYTQNDRTEETHALFKTMTELGVEVSVPVYVTMMQTYSKEGAHDAVEVLWRGLRERPGQTIVLPDATQITIPTQVYSDEVIDLLNGETPPATAAKVDTPFALTVYMDSLIAQERYKESVDLWQTLQSESYPFDVHSYNRYVVVLLRMGQKIEAMRTARRYLLQTAARRSTRRRDDPAALDVPALELTTCREFVQALDLAITDDQFLRQTVVDTIQKQSHL
ncbi:hypothetical protein BCR43DRAFT_491157 [Syncephalastrum racemosum]|uniref:PROP1-like PPR domain-containing protein n=1 Tax=Syncephalastrum racemosum TaxID=13706 RepID=A0A1X2HBI2_SYNRA|nr:hypothetical protein BCR43DRAFT_491157 [Syncephalastrum racemosum]